MPNMEMSPYRMERAILLCLIALEVCVGTERGNQEPTSRFGTSVNVLKRMIVVPENAASGGEASQSSGYDIMGRASNAIDMNRNPYYYAGSCSQTREETDPWWRVDLLRSHMVSSVTITNRWDCCGNRIQGAQIRIGDSLENNGNDNPLCAEVSYIGEGDSATFLCQNTAGRYVNVILPGRNKILTLCEVEVNGTALSTGNVAWFGEATQSSLYNNLGNASNAIDGRRNPIYFDMSCTHTQVETDPWWRVDLRSEHIVFSVTVTNRGDCCSSRIRGAQIRVGNSLEDNGNINSVCAVISSIFTGESQTFHCGEMKGRYVNIFLPGKEKVLTLCEVEVNGFSETSRRDTNTTSGHRSSHNVFKRVEIIPENAASGGEASQSSGYDIMGRASNAIDMNRNPYYYAGSCSHTQEETDPWWRVDLLRSHMVSSVTITNRWDCCGNRIQGAQIRIGDSLENNGNDNPLCAEVSYIGEGDSATFLCQNTAGRYVNVILPGRNKILTLCEVEVNGTALSTGNVALHGQATQSSWYNKLGNASNAIDGRRNPIYFDVSCTRTQEETDPWWRVDLPEEHIIFSVTVTNRGDCCANRIDGAEIRIGNSLENNGNSNPVCAVISSIPAGESVVFDCREMKGRYVNIFLPGTDKILTLCEVEVTGRTLPKDLPAPNNGTKDLDFRNVAMEGKAMQSTQKGTNAAVNAIDGTMSNSCSQTKHQDNPWWRLDLLRTHWVTSVTIISTNDCCVEDLNGAEIRIGNSMVNKGNNNPVCGVIFSRPDTMFNTFKCYDLKGRYVNIFLPGKNKTLTLCEVEVYGISVN